jgi:hypothetical protein
MGDRKKLDEELNRVNELFQEKDLEMRKAGGDISQRQAMRDMLNKKKADLAAQYGDDLTKLNTGGSISIKGAGKKLLGALPLVGAGYAAMQGEPAMASEELLYDVVPGAEAMRSEDAGMSSGDERMMLAEDQARKNYEQSPAKKDRMTRLKAMMQRGK